MLVTFRTITGIIRRVHARSQDGFTLIEVLVAMIILVIGIVGTFGLLDTSAKTSAQTHDREGAVSLAREILEDARTIPFAQLSPGSVVEKLQAMKGLTNATPGQAWHIVRGGSGTQTGATYTITVSECAIDEPKDGLAKSSELSASEAAEYCEEHKGKEEWKAGDAVDSTPIDFKRVTVDVRWPAIGRSPDVHEVAMIGAAGESTALSASELKLLPPRSSYSASFLTAQSTLAQPVITAAAAELTFSVCAPKSATAVLWSLEGVLQSSAAELEAGCKNEEGTEEEAAGKVERNTWTFKWKLGGLSDGTYQISAQATTTKGVLGPPVTIPVTLLRTKPAAPTGTKGGFNEVYVSGVATKAVELEWAANSERNVLGYRVHGPNGALVCPKSETELSLSLSCVEVPRSHEPESGLIYKIAALYRNAGGEVEEGARAEFTLAYPAPAAPNTPTNLKLENFEGAVRLTWEPPAGGEEVAFYRIYRGPESGTCPMNYTNRYDTASALVEPSFTDASSTTKHSYCVTAVGITMTESSSVGPVSG
jgi:prepilin-type N-terminal cleavage/methylation domain-containing protein